MDFQSFPLILLLRIYSVMILNEISLLCPATTHTHKMTIFYQFNQNTVQRCNTINISRCISLSTQRLDNGHKVFILRITAGKVKNRPHCQDIWQDSSGQFAINRRCIYFCLWMSVVLIYIFIILFSSTLQVFTDIQVYLLFIFQLIFLTNDCQKKTIH